MACCLFVYDCCFLLCCVICFCLRVGGGATPDVALERSPPASMSSDSGELPAGAVEGFRVPWTSSIALSRFVWAVQHGVGAGSGPRLECNRVVLSVWIRKLEISTLEGEGGASSLSADEAMLDLLVVSVRSGRIPKKVLI